MRALLALLALLITAGGTAHAQQGPIIVSGGGTAAAGGGGGGTDFTDDSACQGAWIIFTDEQQATAENDHCTLNGDDDLTYLGSTWATSGVPVGSAAGADSFDAAGDGSSDCLQIAGGWDQDDDFEAPDFTISMWVYIDVTGNNDTLFSKSDVENWELRMANSGVFRGEVTDVQESSATGLIDSGSWHYVAMRYDGTGSQADATDDEVEIFVDGLLVCASDCSSSVDPTGNTANLSIGGSDSCSAESDAEIFEVIYLDRTLSDAEMAELFLCGAQGDADGEDRDSNYGLDSCTGSGTPWACCTDVDTGTCIGCTAISTCC